MMTWLDMMAGDEEAGGGKRPPINVNFEFGVKAELKGEVPSASLGRLLDSFTDVIRPFTEHRGLKADLLRLQREEVAFEIAKRARERINLEGGTPKPVSRKLLVPILERGSCEDIEDGEMIDRWASLLSSASLGNSVPPRFVGILAELSGKQAHALEYVAFGESENEEFPACAFYHLKYHTFMPAAIRFEVENLIKNDTNFFFELDKFMSSVLLRINRIGILVTSAVIMLRRGERHPYCYYDGNQYEIEQEVKEGREDIDILESLGLVQKYFVHLERTVPEECDVTAELDLEYVHLTRLGVAFCCVCSRPTIRELEERENRRRRATAK